MTLARRPRARAAIRAVLTLSWLALACRGAPLDGPPAPALSIDGVPIHDWHLAHIDKLVACMQRHGPLRREAWRQEWSSDCASLRLPLAGGSQSDLLAEVRDLYPIDDPACARALPARTRARAVRHAAGSRSR